jgi:hypothetical protein
MVRHPGGIQDQFSSRVSADSLAKQLAGPKELGPEMKIELRTASHGHLLLSNGPVDIKQLALDVVTPYQIVVIWRDYPSLGRKVVP